MFLKLLQGQILEPLLLSHHIPTWYDILPYTKIGATHENHSFYPNKR